MAKKQTSTGKVSLNQTNGKGTTIGNGIHKSSTMNKHKKRGYKPYRGQGK